MQHQLYRQIAESIYRRLIKAGWSPQEIASSGEAFRQLFANIKAEMPVFITAENADAFQEAFIATYAKCLELKERVALISEQTRSVLESPMAPMDAMNIFSGAFPDAVRAIPNITLVAGEYQSVLNARDGEKAEQSPDEPEPVRMIGALERLLHDIYRMAPDAFSENPEDPEQTATVVAGFVRKAAEDGLDLNGRDAYNDLGERIDAQPNIVRIMSLVQSPAVAEKLLNIGNSALPGRGDEPGMTEGPSFAEGQPSIAEIALMQHEARQGGMSPHLFRLWKGIDGKATDDDERERQEMDARMPVHLKSLRRIAYSPSPGTTLADRIKYEFQLDRAEELENLGLLDMVEALTDLSEAVLRGGAQDERNYHKDSEMQDVAWAAGGRGNGATVSLLDQIVELGAEVDRKIGKAPAGGPGRPALHH